MTKEKKRNFVFIVFGPPGSGKSTQAKILANKFSLVEFDTGQVIEKVIFDPQKARDPLIKKQRERFSQGKLCQPSWVAKIVSQEIKKIHQKGKGIVFSGSPRTIYEAKRIIPLLEKLYGQESIFVFLLKVPEKISIFRNTHRRVCSLCGAALIYNQETKKLTRCPCCGGELKERVLDNKKTIKERLKKYREETKPVLKYLLSRKIKVIPINGEPMPEEVSQEIIAKIHQAID